MSRLKNVTYIYFSGDDKLENLKKEAEIFQKTFPNVGLKYKIESYFKKHNLTLYTVGIYAKNPSPIIEFFIMGLNPYTLSFEPKYYK